jgi:murein DD-endopeptidase MepM/ murein hydrolase activator NlpD
MLTLLRQSQLLCKATGKSALFRGFHQSEFELSGPAASAAVSTHGRILPKANADWRIALREKADLGLLWLRLHYRRLDIAHDLAEDIGSARWVRGMLTMGALAMAALSFWPDFSALEAAALPDHTTRDEYRSQMIMPQSLGSESGRHMAPTSAVLPIASAPERAQINLVAVLGEGDSFARMLQRAGVGAGDAERVTGLVASQVPMNTISPGTRVDVTLGKRALPGGPRSLDRLNFRARFDLDLAVSRQGGALALVARPLSVDTTPLRIQGVVGSSLYRSARAAGAPIKAIQQYLQTLDAHLSLDSDISPTDTFDFVVSYKRSAGGESEVGELMYAGLDRAGAPLAQLLRWGSDGQFFEASGLNSQRSAVYAPVAGRLTSGYGMRFHPVLGYSRMHAGVDFGAAWGSPIYAVSDGTVTWSGWHGGHGNYVRLEHGGGMATGYGHMSKIAVANGGRVRAGQVIGYVGSTGLSTGPHLHYEVYQNGRTVNPLSVKFTVAAQVDEKQLAAFKLRLAELKKIAPGAALKSLAGK